MGHCLSALHLVDCSPKVITYPIDEVSSIALQGDACGGSLPLMPLAIPSLSLTTRVFDHSGNTSGDYLPEGFFQLLGEGKIDLYQNT
jgi:hypothetical protein